MTMYVDYTQYTTPAYLEQLKNIEGHEEISLDPKGNPTAKYGITNAALNDVARVVKLRDYEVSDGLKKVIDKYVPYDGKNTKKANNLDIKDIKDKDLFAEIALIHSYVNATEYLDKYTEGGFDLYDKDTQSALLLYFHNNSPVSLRKSMGSEGSILQAIKDGRNRYEVMKTLLMDKDGNFSKDNLTRKFQTIQAMCSPNITFTKEQRDKLEKRWKEPNFFQSEFKALSIMSDADSEYRDYCTQRNFNEQQLKLNDSGAKNAPQSDFQQQPATQASGNEESLLKRAADNFALWLKNLVKKDNEDNQNAQGNTNINLQ